MPAFLLTKSIACKTPSTNAYKHTHTHTFFPEHTPFLVALFCIAEASPVVTGLFCYQVPEYLYHVNKRLEEEADRVITYLDQSTQ